MTMLKTTLILFVTFALLAVAVSAMAAAQGTAGDSEQKVQEQSVEKTSDGGYLIRLGEMYAYYYGYRVQFYGAGTGDYDRFQMNMNTLRVQGDLEGSGVREYYCHLNQISWQYRTGEGYGLLEGYADVDLERSGGPDQGSRGPGGGGMGSRQAPANDDVPGGPDEEPPAEEGKDPPVDDGGDGAGGPEDPLRLQDWARVMIRFQGTDAEGGLKFDIRIQLREQARGQLQIRLEQSLGGEEHRFRHQYMTRTGDSTASGEKQGEYQLQAQNKVVAKYSWQYQYNCTNANGSVVRERTLGEDVSEGESVAFQYTMLAGESYLVHDPSVLVDEDNIRDIMDDAGSLLREHRMSILVGLVTGIVLVIVLTAAVLRARGNGSRDDELFDLESNRYYKK